MPTARNNSRTWTGGSSAAPSRPLGEPVRRPVLPVSALVRLHDISAARLGHAECAAVDAGDIVYVAARQSSTRDAARAAAKPLPLGRALQHRKMYDATLRAMESAEAEEVRRLEEEEIRNLEMDWFASQISALLEEADCHVDEGGADGGRGSAGNAAAVENGYCGSWDRPHPGGVVRVTEPLKECNSEVMPPMLFQHTNHPVDSGLATPDVPKDVSGDGCNLRYLSVVQLPFGDEPLSAKRFGRRTRGGEHHTYFEGQPSLLRITAAN